ncbi:hypothetical protein GmHk_13G037873 [Glycine max]|nr:hypothetical protein GmHk_13G037873 [Glycine max]
MQCGTMLVKSLVGNLGVHDKTNHTLDRYRLKGALKSGVFTPKAYTPKSSSGLLPPDSGPT